MEDGRPGTTLDYGSQPRHPAANRLLRLVMQTAAALLFLAGAVLLAVALLITVLAALDGNWGALMIFAGIAAGIGAVLVVGARIIQRLWSAPAVGTPAPHGQVLRNGPP